MTVAPRMPAASSTLSVPSKLGMKPPAASPGVEADPQRVVEEAEQDDPEQERDRDLEAPVAAPLQRRGSPNETTAVIRPAANSGMPKSRLSAIAAPTNSARSVAIATISACTQRPRVTRPREVLAAQLRQVAAGRDADLRRQVLDQHRHQVRGEQRPTAACSRTWRRRRCSWRSCPGRRRRCRRRTPGRGRRASCASARAPAGARRSLGPACAAVSGSRPAGSAARSRRGSATAGPLAQRGVTRPPRRASRARARRRARASRSPKRANTGPPNGWRSTTSSVVAGRDPALGEVAQHLGVGVGDAHEAPARADARARRARRCRPRRSSGRRSGSGRRAGRASGCPRRAAISSSSSSEMWCSSTSASSWTRSHGTPSSASSSSSRRWWRRTSSATRRPVVGQRDAVVGLVRDEAQLGEPADHPGRRRGRDAEALGERVRRDRPSSARRSSA